MQISKELELAMRAAKTAGEFLKKRENIKKLWKNQGVYGGRKTKKYPQGFDVENHIKTVDIVDN